MQLQRPGDPAAGLPLPVGDTSKAVAFRETLARDRPRAVYPIMVFPMLEMTATIAFFKLLREELRADIEQLECGAYQLMRIEKGERIDASTEKLNELMHRLGNLDRVIIGCEASLAREYTDHQS